MDLSNGRLRLEIDAQTGSIMRVSDPLTGVVHLDATRDPQRLGRLFRVIAPVPRWSSRPGDSWRSGPPRIDAFTDGFRLRYPDVGGPDGPTGVEAEVALTAAPDGRGALLQLRLWNRSDGDVTDVLFPWLGAWQPAAPGTDAITLGGARRVDPHGFPINRGMTFTRWHQRESFTYPIDLYAPWVDLSGPAGGLSLVSEQRTGRNLGVFLENLAGYEPGIDLSVGFSHFTQTRPGESWESPPIRIDVHDGDWHVTADAYSAWVDGWFQAPPTPAWARRSVGFQNVLFRGFDGTPFRSFDRIPEIARAGVAAGVPHLCIWDYAMLGEYAQWDDVPHLGFLKGEAEQLSAALAEARAAGARLSSLHNWRLVKSTTARYRETGHKEVCLRYDGTPFVEEYCQVVHHGTVIATHAGPMVHPVDARVASVRKRVLELFGRTLDMGFDSHFYDQPFENLPSYHPARGADGPDGAHAATVALLGDVRSVLHQRSPEGILIGEYCDVFGAGAIDLWMSWYTEIGDAIRACYSIPQTMNSWVVDHDLGAATRAFAIGAQLCLTVHGNEASLADVPDFAAHVSRLAALKERADRLHLARFRDHDGIEVESDGPAVVGSFSSPGGAAVIIGAAGEAAKVTIRAAGERPGGAAGRLLRQDGTDETPALRDRITLALAPDEVAIWYP